MVIHIINLTWNARTCRLPSSFYKHQWGALCNLKGALWGGTDGFFLGYVWGISLWLSRRVPLVEAPLAFWTEAPSQKTLLPQFSCKNIFFAPCETNTLTLRAPHQNALLKRSRLDLSIKQIRPESPLAQCNHEKYCTHKAQWGINTWTLTSQREDMENVER